MSHPLGVQRHRWEIPADGQPGIYRLVYYGDRKLIWGGTASFNGTSSPFLVTAGRSKGDLITTTNNLNGVSGNGSDVESVAESDTIDMGTSLSDGEGTWRMQESQLAEQPWQQLAQYVSEEVSDTFNKILLGVEVWVKGWFMWKL